MPLCKKRNGDGTTQKWVLQLTVLSGGVFKIFSRRMKQQERVRQMVKARDWEQFHTPKELLLNLVEEIGEFRNIIKWEKDEKRVKEKIKRNFDEVDDFFGDAVWILCSLANYCEVNVEEALERVMDAHEKRYPAKKFKGRHDNFK